MKKKILILGGDPNSINSEIIFKSWKKISKSTRKKIFLISNYNLINDQLKKLNLPIKLKKTISLDDKINHQYLKIIDIPIKYKNPFNVSKNDSSYMVLNSLKMAHKFSLKDKKVLGIINCPINKTLLKKNNIGVTEYLAKMCGIKDHSEVMLLKSKKISVVPITTHLDLNQVSKNINSKIIFKKILTLHSWFKSTLKIKPKICILGLNPHNAELKKNSAEKKIIIPTIKRLRQKGVAVFGPYPADTIFMNEYKRFDVIVGMYHDQVLPAFKALCKFDAINITLGLKYLRVSPDHGVAKKLVKKNKANPLSLINCIKFIDKLN